jgi:CBS domain-containing membrane protein
MYDIAEYMNETPQTLAADDTVGHARQLMTARALDIIAVVGEQGELLAMLGPRDLLDADISEQQTLASIIGYALVTVQKDAGLEVAAACLRDSTHSCLPVVIGKTLVGTIDEACFVGIAIELMAQSQSMQDQDPSDDDLDRRLDEAMGL